MEEDFKNHRTALCFFAGIDVSTSTCSVSTFSKRFKTIQGDFFVFFNDAKLFLNKTGHVLSARQQIPSELRQLPRRTADVS